MFARQPFDKKGLREDADGDSDCCCGGCRAADSLKDQEGEGRPKKCFPHGCHSVTYKIGLHRFLSATAANGGAVEVDAVRAEAFIMNGTEVQILAGTEGSHGP
jgi:hypothetical protein